VETIFNKNRTSASVLSDYKMFHAVAEKQ